MRARRSFSEATLRRLREMPAERGPGAAGAIRQSGSGLFASEGESQPTLARAHRARRVRDSDNRTKWYDTRGRRGGGGAIDLAMHVLGLPFVDCGQATDRRGRSAVVQIIRKTRTTGPVRGHERLGQAAAQAQSIVLREPRPAGFPLLFTGDGSSSNRRWHFCMNTSCSARIRPTRSELTPRFSTTGSRRSSRMRSRGAMPMRWIWWPIAIA